MLSRSSFEVFNDQTLSGRLGRIKREVDPDFEALGQSLLKMMQPQVKKPLYLHIAQHRRRHKNPPVDTWLAISTNKRGYKMLPHFEVGLWPDRLFITLNILSGVQQRTELTDWLIAHLSDFAFQPGLQISIDHTSPGAEPFTLANSRAALAAYQQVKRHDFSLGEWILASDSRFADPAVINRLILARIQDLIPIYRALLQVNH